MTPTVMTDTTLKKSVWSILAILVSVAALAGWLDATGQNFADASFKRALLTFAAARALNGAISVAQGTEIAVEPGGVGVIVSIGQALDPINDLVEQFSTVMLVATSSLGLQNILLEMTAWWGVTALVIVAALSVLSTTLLPIPKLQSFASLSRRLLLITIFMRFAMPLLLIGTTWVFDTFLSAEQAAATAALSATTAEIQEINQATDEAQPENQSLLERLDSAWDEALESLQIGDRLDRLQEALSEASEHIINLIVIFLLQTVVLPIVFVWLLAEALKSIAGRTIGK